MSVKDALDKIARIKVAKKTQDSSKETDKEKSLDKAGYSSDTSSGSKSSGSGKTFTYGSGTTTNDDATGDGTANSEDTTGDTTSDSLPKTGNAALDVANKILSVGNPVLNGSVSDEPKDTSKNETLDAANKILSYGNPVLNNPSLKEKYENTTTTGTDTDTDTDTDATDDFDFATAVQKHMRDTNSSGDDTNWDFNQQYADLALNGDRDTWIGILTDEDNGLMQAYLNDYQDMVDTNGDWKIDEDEAGAWYDKMKAENAIDSSLPDIDDDSDLAKRLYGNIWGKGNNQDIYNAYSYLSALLSTMNDEEIAEFANSNDVVKLDADGNIINARDLISSDDDTTYTDAAGLASDLEEKSTTDEHRAAAERWENAALLNDLAESLANDKDEQKVLLGNINSADEMADYLNELLGSVSDGQQGFQFSKSDGSSLKGDNAEMNLINKFLSAGNPVLANNKGTNFNAEDGSYDYTGEKSTIADDMINSGGETINDNLAYLLLNNLAWYDENNEKHTLASDGYSIYKY